MPWFSLDASQHVLNEVVKIQDSSNQDTEVDVDYFHTRPGVNQLKGGLFKGKSLVYSGLKHVVVRVRPKYEDSALENAILVSSHIDTVITAEGAGDCSSCVAIMLELARVMSQWAQGFKHSVIFLFNTGTVFCRVSLFIISSFYEFNTYRAGDVIIWDT